MEFSAPDIDYFRNCADLVVETCNDLHIKYATEGEYLGSGISRRVYDMGDYVVKIPYLLFNKYSNQRNRSSNIRYGCECNWRELEYYTHNPTKFTLAEVLDYQIINGVHVLFMEKLTETKCWAHIHWTVARAFGLPDWFNSVYDGCQGGFDKEGVFKIYDYADV